MRILLYGINFTPELTGVGKYTGEMADWLVSQGHEVRVVTAPPYYPDWRVHSGFRAFRYATEERDGMRVLRCPIWVPQRQGAGRRLLHLLSFALSSFPVMLAQVRWRPAVVWVVEPSLACAPTACLTAFFCRARTWLHIQDYELDAAFEMGIFRGKGMRRITARFEKWLMGRFDRVSTISSRMRDRALIKGVPADRVVLFPNWASLEGLDPDAGAGLRAELGISPSEVVALYSGTMGKKQELTQLAQAAKLLRHVPRLVFVFCGSGPGRDELEAECRDLPNVRFLDLQPLDRLGALLGMADIHLLPQSSDVADLVMPSKLTGMLASGRPVVATSAEGTELASVVRDRGLLVPPGRPQEMARAIERLVSDPGLRASLGANARTYAEEHLSRDLVLTRFQEALEALVSAGLSSGVAGLRAVILVENLPVPFDRRVWQEARSLAAAGVDLSVVCPKMLGYDTERETLEEVDILRHPLPPEVSSSRGYIREYLAALVWETRLLRRLWRESRFDVIQVCNPPDTLFLAALPYLWRGVSLIYDQHDRSPELYEAKTGKRGLFHRLLHWAERMTFAAADVVIAPNETHAEVATSRGHFKRDRVFVVRSIPDPNEFRPAEDGPEPSFPFDHLVGYLGVMGEQDGVDLLLQAARHIVHDRGRKDVGFVLMGGGPAYTTFTQLATTLELDEYVRFMGYVNRRDAARVLQQCDACVAPDPKNVYTDGCTMNKVVEYMVLGKPIIQFDLVEDRRIAGDAALYAQDNDPISLAENILAITDDEEARRSMSLRSEQRFKACFSWAREADNLLAAYEKSGRASRRYRQRTKAGERR
jgi:colanic acid biosynthesis glycosyl transferase WcaI